MKKLAAAAALLCALLFTLTLTYSGSAVLRAEANTPDPPPAPVAQKADPKAQKAAYDREWNEIKKKYPRFAYHYMTFRATTSQFVLANPDAFRRSELYKFNCDAPPLKDTPMCRGKIVASPCGSCTGGGNCSVNTLPPNGNDPGGDREFGSCFSCLDQEMESGCW